MTQHKEQVYLLRRLIPALSVFVLLLLAFVFIRPHPISSSADRERMWALKTHGNRKSSLVITGDSRSLYGVNVPVLLNAAGTPDITAENASYMSFGYTARMLEQTDHRISGNTGIPASLLLSFSPMSLTDFTRSNFHYQGELRRKKEDWLPAIYLHPLFRGVEPMTPYTVFRLLMGRTNGFYETFHDEGYIEAELVPHNDTLWNTRYTRLYDSVDVSAAIEDTVLQYVRKWSSAGLNVFGAAPPAGQQLFAIEQQKAGWDLPAFSRKFETAGGIWLDAGSPGDYSYFDGLHLDATGAIQLSARLGSQMRGRIGVLTSPAQ